MEKYITDERTGLKYANSVYKTPLTLFQVSITNHTEIISVRVWV